MLKVLSGNASPEETETVENWRKLDTANEKHYSRIKLIWDNSPANTSVTFLPDTDKAWQNVSGILNQKKTKWNLLFKAAAVLLLLIVSGIFIKHLVFDAPEAQAPQITENKPVLKKEEKKEKQKLKTIRIQATDSIKEFFLPDSSLVTLNASSRAHYSDFKESGKRQIVLKGQGHFDVIPYKNLDFVVKTEHLIISTSQARFAVNELKEGGNIELYVEEGRIEVTETAHKTNRVTISAKEKYLFNQAEHQFKKVNYSSKNKWWKSFLSRLRKFFKRLKET
ncbi:MAG: FecR family protein [Sediminibacterium sp.]|nr:FecR family protein [Sediminibacterium sp.]